ncbi:MAG: hypothetical protein CMG75_04865 [Candidatus Marinimicrobia bacterium]|nr:hypothetical protein [Candidatus Neomarinimicrobiota bacterium]|tara:strand:- start:11132 stop:11941 length:810 start_codon:yes stop_codon:yes gene_type:complete
MITITFKVIRIISLISLLTFLVNIAQAQRQKTQRKKKNSIDQIDEHLFFPQIEQNFIIKETQKNQRKKLNRISARIEGQTEDIEMPKEIMQVEEGDINEIKVLKSSGRKMNKKNSGRVAGQSGVGDVALNNFKLYGEEIFIAKTPRKWINGTVEQIAQACLNDIGCDAFYVYDVSYDYGSSYRTKGVLCDDIDPPFTWRNGSSSHRGKHVYTNIKAYYFYDKATEDRVMSAEARIFKLREELSDLQIVNDGLRNKKEELVIKRNGLKNN